jgi:hypothetical protein
MLPWQRASLIEALVSAEPRNGYDLDAGKQLLQLFPATVTIGATHLVLEGQECAVKPLAEPSQQPMRPNSRTIRQRVRGTSCSEEKPFGHRAETIPAE